MVESKQYTTGGFGDNATITAIRTPVDHDNKRPYGIVRRLQWQDKIKCEKYTNLMLETWMIEYD